MTVNNITTGSAQDEEQSVAANASLELSANELLRDPLTSLFNRAHLNTCLEGKFRQLKHDNGSAAFVLVGIDHFDLINKVYGYEAGDAVIVEVSKRLRESLRDVDTIGRYSGARIGIILDDCDERGLLIAGHRVLNELRDKLVQTERGPVAVSAAVGGVVIPHHASNPRRAFQGAHQALSDSRRERDSTIVSYRPDPQRDAIQKRAAIMAQEIVSALQQGRIHLEYQPIVDAKTHAVEYYEALVRLESEDGGVLSAEEFVKTAEKLGMVRLVDHFALELAVETLEAHPDAKLSLNVSNETAGDPEWLSKLAIAAYRQPDLVPRLIVEITESHAVENFADARRFIESLHDLGFKIALDDFGAGFTSFRNLKSLPFDIIKVDGHFATDMENNPENTTFIKVLVQLASLFDAKTVVEWVEDAGSADKLRDWGVDYLQGYKFGKPVRYPKWRRKPSSDPSAVQASLAG